MGSRDSDEEMAPHHPPHLSSLVVRPTDSGGGGGAAAAGSDYEPGEVRRGDPPPYSRSDRFGDKHGYRMRAGSASPVRRRAADRHYSPEFGHTGGQSRIRGFGRGRDPPRYRDYSPPFGGRGRHGGRLGGRGFDGPGFGLGPSRGEGMPRNNPNVRPREGDWICSDPRCQNLNFARRDSCNNCNRPRYGPGGSPRRGYGGPLPPFARRFPGPPMDRSPGRVVGGYRSPPHSWARDGPRELGLGGPPHPRREGRFFDHPVRRDRPDYLEDDLRERSRLERPMPPLDWGRERGRDSMNDRKAYERRPLSPPLPLQPPPPRGRWPHDVRERSRSPIRELPPPKDFRRDMYMQRGRDDRRALGRERVGDAY